MKVTGSCTVIEPSPAGKRLLLVTYYPPERGTGGGLRLLDMYRLLSQHVSGLSLTLLACDHGAKFEPELFTIFERVMALPPAQFNESGLHATGLLEERFDAVDLQFLQAGDLVRLFKRSGFPRVVVSPMESQVRAAAIALARQQIPFVPTKRWLLGQLPLAVRELRAVWSADRVMCVSTIDARSLRKLRFWGGLLAVETGVSPAEFGSALRSAPSRLLKGVPTVTYLAYFGSRTNVEALDWYLEYVHPLIKTAVSGYRLRIAGRGLSHLPANAGDGVDLVGEIDSLEDELNQAWVGIAPALSGAGMRGKINQYAIMGVPCVASTLAGEGFAYEDGHSIRLADNATVFARACIDLLASIEYNQRMGQAARQVCLREYSWESKLPLLRQIFAL